MAGSLIVGRPSPFQRTIGRGVHLSAGGAGGGAVMGGGEGLGGPPAPARPNLPIGSGMNGYGFGNRLGPMSQYRTAHNPRTDGTLNVTDATNAGQTVQAWAPSSGINNGGGGGSGRFGPFTGRPRIGSAAGALGSSGTPTSQRGRLEKFGPEAAMTPSWMVAEAVRNNGGGLSQTGGFPDEVTPHEQLMSDATNFEAVQQAPGMNPTGAPRKIDPLTGLPRYGRGTGIGRGRPIPWNEAFIAGDPKKGSHKPNEEIILPTPEGIHVIPVDDLPQLGDGTGTISVKDAGQDKRPLKRTGLKPPLSGLAEFHQLNPTTPPAAITEMQKLLTHPELPTPIRLPALPAASHGTESSPLKKYAKGTDSVDPETAIEALTGQRFQDGEVRNDSQGNAWRYNSSLGHGVPLNPYLLHPNAPSPNAVNATAAQRYADLAQRLSGLRQAGMAAGRARVAEMQAQQQQQEAAQRLPASELWRTNLPGGGQSITGRYGTAAIGQNLPKSFTVERMDGTAGRFNNLADASAESAADAAQRHVHGVAMNTGRGIGAGVPTALEYLTGEMPPDDMPSAPVLAASIPFQPLPDDRPSTVESRRRAWNMHPSLQRMTLDRAKTRGKEALVRRAGDFGSNLRTAVDLGILQPIRDLGTNAATAWDILTQ